MGKVIREGTPTCPCPWELVWQGRGLPPPRAGGQGCQGNWATHPPEEAEHREGLCMCPWVPLGVGEDQGPRSGLAGGRRRAVGLFIIMGARSELPPLE